VAFFTSCGTVSGISRQRPGGKGGGGWRSRGGGAGRGLSGLGAGVCTRISGRADIIAGSLQAAGTIVAARRRGLPAPRIGEVEGFGILEAGARELGGETGGGLRGRGTESGVDWTRNGPAEGAKSDGAGGRGWHSGRR